MNIKEAKQQILNAIQAYLIEEENTLFDASGFDSVIKSSHDLTHRVLGYLHVSTGVVSMYKTGRPRADSLVWWDIE